MKNISLVIQGPVISQAYNCTDNISRLIEHFASKVDCIVLSTWEGEHFSITSVKCPFYILKSRLLDGRDSWNRRRQWISTYEGVKFVKENVGSDFVIKIRTDQYVHNYLVDFLQTFYKEHNKLTDNFQKEYILFSFVRRNVPFYIEDFYFAGHIADIENLLRSALYYKDEIFQYLPELDLILKYLKKNDPSFPIPFQMLYKQMALPEKYPKNSIIWKYWLEQYKNKFACFPRDLCETLEWRGERPYHNEINAWRGRQVWQVYNDYYEEWLLCINNRGAYFELPSINEQHERWLYDWIGFLWKVIKKTKKVSALHLTAKLLTLKVIKQIIFARVIRNERVKKIGKTILSRRP